MTPHPHDTGRAGLVRTAGAVLGALLVVLAAACRGPLTTAPPPPSPPAASAERASTATRVDAPLPVPTPVPLPNWAATCPVTRPGGVPLPPDVLDAVRANKIFGAGIRGEGLYGRSDGLLWVGGLPERGLIGFTPQLGEERWKLGWWLRREGQLRIEGRRLDAEAPPLGSSVPDGHGSRGFQSSGIIFPSEGCWEVVGRLGDEELRFVMLVVASRF